MLFRDGIWPQVYQAVEEFKLLAEREGHSLATLALRWLLRRPGVTSVLVSAKNAEQALANIRALEGDIPDQVFDELTALSDRVIQYIPDEGNPFGYHP